jgi:N-acetylmuramoyl-L-alanine amidase
MRTGRVIDSPRFIAATLPLCNLTPLMFPRLSALTLLMLVLAGCKTAPKPGTYAPRRGDEIIVAGQPFHTGTRVVTWMDPGGYDAYRVERRFAPYQDADWEKSKAAVKDLTTPNRYNLRGHNLGTNDVERVRGGGWELPDVQDSVDQFVLHYDVCGTSRQCFKVLHDLRGLSVHFLLDIDGTIYQTLDVKERAWHATTSNSRSVGIEIANMGAWRAGAKNPYADWYATNVSGQVFIKLPARLGDGGVLTPNFTGHPARNAPVRGVVQGAEREQWDFTPQQYEALSKLTATLCTALPRIRCDYPRDAQGRLITSKLPDDELASYQGVLGHFHIQTNKIDPGPAFQWDRVINEARRFMGARPAALPRGGELLLP